MEKKFFTRLGLLLTNICNQKCAWCFEGEWKNQKKQMMKIEDIRKILKWKDWNDGSIPVVYLLGGEPTLHPQLLEIIDMIKEYNPRISIFLLTNLTCNQKLLTELIKRKVVIFANVDQFELTNNIYNQKIILSNLDYLNNCTNKDYKYNISATISDTNKDFDFLYKIIENCNNKIYNLRLAPSCIGYKCENEFQKDIGNSYYQKAYEVLEKCLEIKPDLHLSTECAVNGCFISDKLYEKLYKIGYKLRYECGFPEPNADILPDLSVHWCFSFEGVPELSVDNIFKYDSYNDMLEDLYIKYNSFQDGNDKYCNKENCNHEMCKGRCAALNYYSMLSKK